MGTIGLIIAAILPILMVIIGAAYKRRHRKTNLLVDLGAARRGQKVDSPFIVDLKEVKLVLGSTRGEYEYEYRVCITSMMRLPCWFVTSIVKTSDRLKGCLK